MFRLPAPRLQEVLLRLASYAVILVFAVCVAAPIAEAQTVNPHLVSFLPSPDHDAIGDDGQPLVSQYNLAFYPVGGSQPLVVVNLGKPTPDADGSITVDFSTLLTSAPAPGQQLEARVGAVGPGGTDESDVSNAVSFDCTATVTPTALAQSAAAGSGIITVGVFNSCGWLAASTVPWITIAGDAGGTGSGTVGFAVAANATATPRVGTLTIAGQTVTVTQAAATNMPPSVQLTSPASGAVFTAPASVTLAATANDSDGAIANVEFYVNALLVGSTGTAPYSIPWTSVTAGSYTVTAVAVDNSGAKTTSASVSITVAAPSNAPPTVQITNPIDNSSTTSPANVTIAATASDADGTVVRVDFYVNGAPVGGDTAGPYTLRWNTGAAGTYTFTAVATDNAGASSTSLPVTMTVTKKNGK